MNIYERKNIKLLNLVEHGFSGRTILRIIESCTDHYVTEQDLKNELGVTPTYVKMIKAFKEVDMSTYSIYCLYKFDINMIVIEKLRLKYKTLEDLSKNLNTLQDNNLQIKTEKKLIDALKDLRLNYFINLEEEIFREIEKFSSYPNYTLKEKILNKYTALKVEEFDNAVDILIGSNRIIQSVDGLKIKNNVVREYLSKSNDYRDIIVLSKLNGETLQQIADQKNVSRERIRQIINNRIKKYPIFYNEERYYRILKAYDLTNSELELIGLNDQDLIEYIKVKYKLKPMKNSLDYIADFNLSSTELGQQILKNNNLVLINGDLVQSEFVQILRKYVNKRKIHSFSLNDIKEDFNLFLKFNRVNLDDMYIKTEEDIKIKNRKLSNSHYFLPLGNQKFLVYRPNSLSSDFIETLDNFLSEFYGYGSIGLFFDSNIEICKKNYIDDEKELFVVAKELLRKKHGETIEFVRNPTILSSGVNKASFIENMILDMDLPCTVDSYLEYVNKVTGLKGDSVYGAFSKIINRYKNSQGLITLDNEVTDEQYNYVKNLIGNAKCVGYSYVFNRVELKYGSNAQIILNNNNLKKIGFIKTNTSIYSDKFSSRMDAVIDAIDKFNQYIMYEKDLKKISNIEYFYYKTYDFVDTNILIKIDNDEYLNLRKRNQCDLIKQLKQDMLDILEPNEVYVLNDFVNSSTFYDLIEKNEEYKNLIFSMNSKELIKNIIISLRGIYYIEISNTLIFSKRGLSINILIDDILNEYGALSLYELQETLFEYYGIKKALTNSELSDMGYYCPRSSDRVYLTKEFYEKELEEYLNGNS